MLIGRKALIRVILGVFIAVVFGTSANAEIFMSISGIIKDATTGKGIAGVEVIAGDLLTKKNYSAVTGENGAYFIKLVPEGEYTVYAYPSGKYIFKPYTKNVTVEKGKNVVDTNFELPLGGTVSGTLYLSDGITPLANRSLFALTDKGVAISSTGPDGKYILAGLVPESAAKIRLISYGYGMLEMSNINIAAGQVTTNVNAALPPATSGIRGTVFSNDSISLPISDAYVLVKGDAGFGITTTDTNGNYEISGLPDGVYEATIFKIGYVSKTLPGVGISKSQYINQNYYLTVQPLPVLLSAVEKQKYNTMFMKFPIANNEYPEVNVEFVGSGGCGCFSVSFTSTIGIGVSIGQAKCLCSQSCGSTRCTSVKTVNTICTCFGFGIGASAQVQACNNIPQTGYTDYFGVDIPTGTPVGVSLSAGGGCAGAGAGLGTPGLYWCSCYASVQ